MPSNNIMTVKRLANTGRVVKNSKIFFMGKNLLVVLGASFLVSIRASGVAKEFLFDGGRGDAERW
jgi:hypothetical protein